ncbi:YbhB/YbcL family Raf kinase inhibitor-like protein [Paraeggerthella hongkongensis]|uniref:YbhB/YbcL family Raf kinase inhibitor-like protein n=1 Tax=Paraeggerthella TaxID=651554 RepID=UPI001C0F3C24|nr:MULTISPECIES: YbhB/YbcL family Raf kinase inhibitor-like protein [Paraeggerthella]MBU5405836.1 YbhB/YbcL family Raf kinase inhibitor-like protein [Paraeggerthella hongkongensis]MCD2433683.1 YbhB/YbcL family Raf kinase inhibitor-like protein [Paraeggerthella hominis]
MRVTVELENGLLPDRFGKYAPEEYTVDGNPVRSFPFEVTDVPEGARSLALAFVDWDAIPVGGFCWIHWLACNIAPDATRIPENASASGAVPCVQGSNSNWSPLAGGSSNPQVTQRYSGPYPPDKTHVYTLTVYALDCELDLPEGYYLNEFRRAIQGHVLARASVEFPSRA